jgi:hypothetical protein
VLYFVQNNMLLVAVANLAPPVYYVVSQVFALRISISLMYIYARHINDTRPRVCVCIRYRNIKIENVRACVRYGISKS